MSRRLPRLVRWLLTRAVPPEWRDSILGDAEETWPRRGWRALATAAAVAIRLAWERRGERPGEKTSRPARSRWTLDELATDVRHAARSLARHRAYAGAAVATLAIGIGANVSVFSLANQVLLRPVPGLSQPDRVVTLIFGSPQGFTSWFSMPAVERLRAGVPALASLTAYGDVAVHAVVPGGVATRLDGEVVTAGFFEVMGAALQHGRGFSDEETRLATAAPVAIVSDRFWRTDLGGSTAAIGRPIVINGTPWIIVGIAAPGFHGPSRNGTTDLWVPFGQFARVWPWYGPTLATDADSRVFAQVIGRLASGAALADVAVEADAVRAQLSAENPKYTMLTRARFLARAGIHESVFVETELTRSTLLLSGIVALLLLLTCANVGGLTLAHGVSRRHDVATRLALGATRARVVRLLFVESLLLALVAGAASVGLAVLVGRALDGVIVLRGLPPVDGLAIDARVLGAALAISVLSALAGGILPAFAGSRPDVQAELRAVGRSQAPGRGRWTRALTVFQVAVSLALLIGSLLLVRSMAARHAIDPGFTPDRVVRFSVDPPTQGYPADRIRTFYRTLVDRVRALPGVRTAAYAWAPPYSRMRNETYARPALDSETKTLALLDSISEGYFAALGAPLVEGVDLPRVDFTRPPTGADRPVIVTPSLARALFGTAPAVGRRVYLEVRGTAASTIVGVVGEIRHTAITEPDEPMVFQAAISSASSQGTIVVGVDGDVRSLLPRLRDTLASIDPSLPMYDMRLLTDVIAGDLAQDALVMRLAAVFAGLASLLAAVGLYGVLARGVVLRRRELSIRVALGARPAAIARLITSEAIRVGAAGVAIGLVAAAWLSRYLESWLFGVRRFDAVAIGGALALIAVVLVASACVPARRAARIDCAAELK
jgi:predicted permease